MSSELERVLDYHRRTKHHLGRFARGPGRLDWATQPDPFRRYQGAPLLALEQVEPGELPAYRQAFLAGHIVPEALNRTTISQLFCDSLALSAWKRWGDASWSLRVNPSSGNLHPTEGYLVCGPVAGLTERPAVCHYAPRQHALEVRIEFPLEVWQSLTAGLPPDSVLVALTSIHWREAWKYGERAFRYCQLDVGHAIAAVCLAAAGLGWQATLLDDVGTEQLGQLLGVFDSRGAEEEEPDCLLAMYPRGESGRGHTLPAQVLRRFAGTQWLGRPNLLSPGHVAWSLIDDVSTATKKPATQDVYGRRASEPGPGGPSEEMAEPLADGEHSPRSLRRILRQRRSAVAMDGRGSIGRNAFYEMLRRTLPQPERPPFGTLPWRPMAHLVLFVHRVNGLVPGLYILVRDPGQRACPAGNPGGSVRLGAAGVVPGRDGALQAASG